MIAVGAKEKKSMPVFGSSRMSQVWLDSGKFAAIAPGAELNPPLIIALSVLHDTERDPPCCSVPNAPVIFS
jgi:hypothetical protein